MTSVLLFFFDLDVTIFATGTQPNQQPQPNSLNAFCKLYIHGKLTVATKKNLIYNYTLFEKKWVCAAGGPKKWWRISSETPQTLQRCVHRVLVQKFAGGLPRKKKCRKSQLALNKRPLVEDDVGVDWWSMARRSWRRSRKGGRWKRAAPSIAAVQQERAWWARRGIYQRLEPRRAGQSRGGRGAQFRVRWVHREGCLRLWRSRRCCRSSHRDTWLRSSQQWVASDERWEKSGGIASSPAWCDLHRRERERSTRRCKASTSWYCSRAELAGEEARIQKNYKVKQLWLWAYRSR